MQQLLDIKNFKRINENFGHQAGDDVLRQVAGVLRDVAAGKGDVLRYSGDDFVTVFFIRKRSFPKSRRKCAEE